MVDLDKKMNQKNECWDIMLIQSLFLFSSQKLSLTTLSMISSDVILKMKAKQLIGFESAFYAFIYIESLKLSKIFVKKIL